MAAAWIFLGEQVNVDAFSATITKSIPKSSGTASIVYDGLSSTPVIRASDEGLVMLTDLWRSNTPFGVADDIAVCAFLRHFG